MPYKTRRERRYRRKAKAAALKPQSAGGWGQGAPIRPADLLLIRRAIRERWDVPEATRDEIARRLHEILDCDYSAIDARMWIAVCRAIIAMVGDNQRRREEEIRAALRQPSGGTSLG